MDPSRFDDVLRTLSAHRSRRAFGSALVATLVSILLGRAAGEAQTVCLTLNQKCKLRGTNRPRCCSGLRCHKHRCRRPQCRLGSQGTSCGEGALCCNGFCLDVRADPSNCGACGRTCLDGERCLGGNCVSPCVAGLTHCGGICVDVLSDPVHCGACNFTCRAVASRCVAGQCRCPDDLTVCNDACVDTQTEPAHCGGCGRACPTGDRCQAGVCTARCRDNGQTCQTDTECCRAPEATCNDGVCTRRCSVYGGACVTQADCCETRPGTRPPCSGGLCRYN